MEDLFKTKAKENLKTSTGGSNPRPVPTLAQPNDPKKTRDKLAKVAGISHGTLDKVKVIEEKAKPEQKAKFSGGNRNIKCNDFFD